MVYMCVKIFLCLTHLPEACVRVVRRVPISKPRATCGPARCRAKDNHSVHPFIIQKCTGT